MNPVAATMAVKAVRAQAGSARPDAPVVRAEPARNSPARRWITAYLRASAHRRTSLADRLDHSRATRPASAARSLGVVGGCPGARASTCTP
ncbi:hypothetical protein [Nocardia brasiliensis]|uniref:hypothetical protein n=1 Tax=Nocardia brasiliensis TaxID=37326 RepID=UPI002455B25C|nr:hypothetical protein [Nocardia brasiliensis]